MAIGAEMLKERNKLATLTIFFLIVTVFAAPAFCQSASASQSSPSVAQINEICERYDAVARRITAANDGLRSIRQQMAAQGFRLREDVLEAADRMRDRRDHARDAISHYDLEAATEDLNLAEYAVEAIEKFLGR